MNPRLHAVLVGLVGISLLGPRIGVGQIYKSVDEQGRTVYSDQPAPETPSPQGTPANGLSNSPATTGSMPSGTAASTGRRTAGAAGVVVAPRPAPAPVPDAPGQVFVAKPPYRPAIGNTVASIDIGHRIPIVWKRNIGRMLTLSVISKLFKRTARHCFDGLERGTHMVPRVGAPIGIGPFLVQNKLAMPKKTCPVSFMPNDIHGRWICRSSYAWIPSINGIMTIHSFN